MSKKKVNIKKVFETTKPVWKSTTVWAALVSLMIAILSIVYGEGSLIVMIVIAISSVFGIRGRLLANTSIK